MPSWEVKVERLRDRHVREHELQNIENLCLHLRVGEGLDALGIVALEKTVKNRNES